MEITLTAISDPESSKDVSPILQSFRVYLLPLTEKIIGNSPSASFLVIISVVNSDVYGEFGKNRRGYSTKENAVRVTKRIDYKAWQSADWSVKIDLFANCLANVFDETNTKRLPVEYKQPLLQAIDHSKIEIKLHQLH
jgi:hypothetical protein